MSIGFSVGVIAVRALIADITSSLSESGGSKSEKQELLRELESLQHALSHIRKLQLGQLGSTKLDTIKYTARGISWRIRSWWRIPGILWKPSRIGISSLLVTKICSQMVLSILALERSSDVIIVITLIQGVNDKEQQLLEWASCELR